MNRDYKHLQSEAKRLLNEGWLQKDIADFLQVSQQAVTRWLKAEKYAVNSATRLKKRKDVKKALYLYLIKGYHQSSIANELGYSTQMIGEWFKELGINARSENYAYSIKNIISDMKLNNDLGAFMEYLDTNYPPVRELIEPFYKDFKTIYGNEQ